ncbi:MAG: TraR/DksA C4-type zinc finger protein [Candidatus Omnitrophica bacterium]|jgi:RNA polymerase-binding protein DksA|nr:TraR/DksA C4-type zinc finger protein [Candidatus Omnitrophota bacterium]
MIKRKKVVKAAKTRKAAGKVKKAKIKKMPKTVLKKYRELLVKEREKVGGGLSHITENTLNKSQRDASGDLSGYSYHMADMASDDYEREFSLGRATDEQKMLYQIDEAMKRIKDGTYGNCLQCGKSISQKRLMALPYSELCIECQKANEEK